MRKARSLSTPVSPEVLMLDSTLFMTVLESTSVWLRLSYHVRSWATYTVVLDGGNMYNFYHHNIFTSVCFQLLWCIWVRATLNLSFGLWDVAKMVLSQNYHQYHKTLMHHQHQVPSMNKLGIEILTEKKIKRKKSWQEIIAHPSHKPFFLNQLRHNYHHWH